MDALVLEEKGRLALRDFPQELTVGPGDVRIKVHTVGICGSDVHYYTHGKIGPFVVGEPMVLGHEGSGTVVEVGRDVTGLKPGDRVCIEPGIPSWSSRAARMGLYNLDPAVRFWATPPVHGCLTPEVVHPAELTFKLPDNVSFAEGAMVEPLAVGVQAAVKAGIKPGDTGVVTGAGPIGMVTALSALAAGCARVLVSDVSQPKLDLIGRVDGIEPVNIRERPLREVVAERTEGWGAEVVFECSGAAPAVLDVANVVSPGGTVILVGMPVDPVPVDVVGLQAKEATVRTVFRYANVYDRAIALLGSGKIDVKPFITETFPFSRSVEAFDRAVEGRPTDVKLQIALPA